MHVGSRRHRAAATSTGASGETIFENSDDARNDGDGAYVFDPQGDLRTWSIYPCLVACTRSQPGCAARGGACRAATEYAHGRPTRRGQPVDLYGYELFFGGGNYAFPEGTVLPAGRTLTVYVGGSPASDSGLAQYAGIRGAYLPDSGGAVELRTFEETVLSCSSWGSGRC